MNFSLMNEIVTICRKENESERERVKISMKGLVDKVN